jgi:hypothetical protein
VARTLLSVVLVLASAVVFAESRPPAFRAEAFGLRPAVRVPFEVSAQHLLADLPAVEALPKDSELPVVGVVRALDAVSAAEATPAITTVRSRGATRVRLRLDGVHLAHGATLIVAGRDGLGVEFDAGLTGADGELWTPSVTGDTIAVTARGDASYSVGAIAHIVETQAVSTTCLQDAACAPYAQRTELQSSIAQLEFVKGNGVYVCTGGLINGPDGARLLLTANHCISAASSARSVEARWDWRSVSCGSSANAPTLVTNGATLLTTSATTDVTLLRMDALPAGRWLMGWSTDTLARGTRLHRISHPADPNSDAIYEQAYSSTTFDDQTGTCTGAARPSFLYSTSVSGGIFGGSSGAPVLIDGGYIVGQLLGLCGSDPTQGCGGSINRTVDGSLRESYAVLKPYLDPGTTSTCTACTPNGNTACLLGNRFKVTMPSWRDTPANLSGQGTVIRYADNLPEIHPDFGPLSESAFFSMYAHAPKSIETLVRMIKGQNINNKFWVFLTGFTGAEYTIKIEDTQSCKTWQRTVASGATNVVKDFEAFSF